MIKNLRFELSFKDIFQLESKLKFCISNNINKINIPCKGCIKKTFLNKTIEYIGENYSELDVIYHYSLYHQYTNNVEASYVEFLKFMDRLSRYNNEDILIVSGSNKKKNFEILDVLNNLTNEKFLTFKIGTAYNPYLKKHYKILGERLRFEQKNSSGLINSIWIQFGTDINLLESEFNFLKKSTFNNHNNHNDNIKFFGSLLIPSKQFIARFKFRPWKGVYIAEKYLYSLDEFYRFTIDLIEFYLDNNICPVIETDFYSKEKLDDIYTLLKK